MLLLLLLLLCVSCLLWIVRLILIIHSSCFVLPPLDCGNCEWTLYKDWLAIDTRQILFQTHNTPANANELFAALLEAGYVIYSREADMHPWHSRRHFLNVDWSVIKLDPKFSKAPPADGSGR